MRARVWLHGTLVLVLATPVVWAQGAKTLYDAQKPNGGTFLKAFTGWGSGTIDKAKEGTGLVITTSGYYEGGQLSFAGAKVEDAVANVKNGYLTLSIKVEQTATAATVTGAAMGSGGSSRMGPGMMGPGGAMGSGGPGMMGPGMMGPGGAMGSGGPGMMGPGMMGPGGAMGSGGPGMMGPGMMGPGGAMGSGGMMQPGMMGSGGPGMMGPGMMGPGGGAMGPGMMGSGGMGMAGAVEAPRQLGRLRVVLVTDKGSYAIEDVDANGIPSQEEGWETIALPLAEFASRVGVPAGEVREVRICGDSAGKISVGSIQLIEEDPADVVNVTAPEDATYEWGDSFSLKATVDDPTKQYRIHWDFDKRDGVTYDGETGDTVEDANYYFTAPGQYTVTVICVPVTNRALPRLATCRITINAPAGQGGMMGPGMMGPGMMGPGGGGMGGMMGGGGGGGQVN